MIQRTLGKLKYFPLWENTSSPPCKHLSMISIASEVRPKRSEGGMPNVSNSSNCEPTETPKSNRPLETMSTAAMSYATRKGLWNGMQMMDVPIRRRSVRAAMCESMTNGDELPEAKQKWCSPINAESYPSFSASTASFT